MHGEQSQPPDGGTRGVILAVGASLLWIAAESREFVRRSSLPSSTQRRLASENLSANGRIRRAIPGQVTTTSRVTRHFGGSAQLCTQELVAYADPTPVRRKSGVMHRRRYRRGLSIAFRHLMAILRFHFAPAARCNSTSSRLR